LLDRKCELNAQNTDGNTPLHFAALKGNELIMTLLLKAGSDANIQNNNKFTPLHLTCQFGEYIKSKILLKAGAKINQKGSQDYTPLHFAISSKNTDLVQLLISQGANIDQASLYSAVHVADLELVMLLLSKNHNLNFNTENLIEALLNAESRNLDLLNYLLRKGSDPNSLCGPLTNLALACKVDCFGYVECLLQHGASVNACGLTGTTPLMATCMNKHLAIANLLMESGAVVNQKDDQGWNSFFYACSNGNLDLVKCLHKKGSDIFLESKTRSTALIEASQHTPIIKYLVDNGLSVNHKNNDNCTPLFNACLYDNYQGALYLIEKGAEINAVTESKRLTPLHAASMMGHAEIVKLLLFFNADVTIKSTSGNTPLLNAVSSNKLEVVKLFADLLTNAETSGNDYGITNRSELDSEWQRCFLHAAVYGFLDILKFLHETGLIMIDGTNPENLFSALHYACYSGKYDVAHYLIENGADVNAESSEDFVPLYLASHHGHLDLVKLLVTSRATIDAPNFNGNTALFSAAANGFLKIVQYLYENGAKVHVVDQDGDTPLHDAACRGHLSTVEYLVSRNAEVNYKNKNNKTPLDLAIEKECQEVVELLKVIIQSE
jgi:ankyrin repeat protein